MRYKYFIAAIVAVLSIGTTTATADLSQVQINQRLVEQRNTQVAVETAWAQRRADLDVAIRANTRTLFRAQLIPLRNFVSSPAEKDAVTSVLNVLAAPGPAPSASKTIHEVTRQAGAWAAQQDRAAIRVTEDFLADLRAP